jgi:hypothetical protein
MLHNKIGSYIKAVENKRKKQQAECTFRPDLSQTLTFKSRSPQKPNGRGSIDTFEKQVTWKKERNKKTEMARLSKNLEETK